MHVESVTVQGFRCFGAYPVTVALSPEVTGVVGANASGMTALLMALARMFGVSRNAQWSAPIFTRPSEPTRRMVRAESSIEVVLALPELAAARRWRRRSR